MELRRNTAAGTRSTLTPALAAAGTVQLDRWTLDRAVRAEHAAVAGRRAQHDSTALALVEELACIRRHGFLIDEPTRPYIGYRTYADDDVRRIRFIKRAQLLGFTLDEISSLLKLEGSQTCASTRDLAAKKLAMVEAKLSDLLAMKAALATMVSRCDSEHPSAGCPIIQALIDD